MHHVPLRTGTADATEPTSEETLDVNEINRPIDTAALDESVPAADDFYLHVNRRWLAANPVPPEQPIWGSFHVTRERNQELLHHLLEVAAGGRAAEGSAARLVGDYFAAGMDEAAIAAAGIAPLRPYLDGIDAITSIGDVRAVALDLHRAGAGPFFGLEFEADFEDADAYLVYLQQAGLGLPDRDYYLRDDERSIALRSAYTAHVAAQLANLGAPRDEAEAAAKAILAFEHRLAEASLAAELRRDPQLTMNRHEVVALDELMPGFGLGGFVRELGVEAATVSLEHPAFFRELDAAIVATPPEVLRDVLRWHLVRVCASALPPAFEDEAFSFYGRTLGGQQEQQPRWKRVLRAAGSDIGDAVSRLYVEAAFPPHAKARCEEMVGHLLSAMGRAIRDAGWMTEPTREQALAKHAEVTFKIGYPSRWLDYAGLDLGRASFVGNRLAAAAFEVRRQLARLGEPVDRAEWAMPAHSVNAYYHPLHNEIVFPAGILQPPMFWADADDAVNYGGIGTVIGHEITHGFDDSGSRFDAAGRLRDWWTEEDRAEFERRANVIVEQFDGYVAIDDSHVNGRLTLGENIADLGGLAIAYDALQEALGAGAAEVDGRSPTQRFFLAYATMWRTNVTDEMARVQVATDPHAPARFRVNGPLSNLPVFAEAFGIPEGSPMARPDPLRAKVW